MATAEHREPCESRGHARFRERSGVKLLRATRLERRAKLTASFQLSRCRYLPQDGRRDGPLPTKERTHVAVWGENCRLARSEVKAGITRFTIVEASGTEVPACALVEADK